MVELSLCVNTAAGIPITTDSISQTHLTLVYALVYTYI